MATKLDTVARSGAGAGAGADADADADAGNPNSTDPSVVIVGRPKMDGVGSGVWFFGGSFISVVDGARPPCMASRLNSPLLADCDVK